LAFIQAAWLATNASFTGRLVKDADQITNWRGELEHSGQRSAASVVWHNCWQWPFVVAFPYQNWFEPSSAMYLGFSVILWLLARSV